MAAPGPGSPPRDRAGLAVLAAILIVAAVIIGAVAALVLVRRGPAPPPGQSGLSAPSELGSGEYVLTVTDAPQALELRLVSLEVERDSILVASIGSLYECSMETTGGNLTANFTDQDGGCRLTRGDSILLRGVQTGRTYTVRLLRTNGDPLASRTFTP
ncbi:MAG TPA: hypothetical protein VJ397_04370 [Thermoplasmata archaeon]|nr:hypothetical protein [Thermoplasmata archaeon]